MLILEWEGLNLSQPILINDYHLYTGAPFDNFTILAAGHDFVQVSFSYSEINISSISTNNMESCSVNCTNIQVFVKCDELNQTFALIVIIETFDRQNYIVLADLEPSPPTVSSGKKLDFNSSSCVHQLYALHVSIRTLHLIMCSFELIHSTTVSEAASSSPITSETGFNMNNG